MKKGEIIVIICKTDSYPIFNLVSQELKLFFGEENVNSMIFNLHGNIEDRVETFFKYALLSKKYIQLILPEGARVYNEQLCFPFAKKLKNKKCKFSFVLDTSTSELLYSGTLLRTAILKQIYELRGIIELIK